MGQSAPAMQEFQGARGNPVLITSGPDGALWFTEYDPSWIGRITPDGVLTNFPLQPNLNAPFAIAAGPDGYLWFTVPSADIVARISPTGHVDAFSIPADPAGPAFPRGITVGPDGALWFTEGLRNKIGRITFDGLNFNFTESKPTPTANSQPEGITLGPDGALWFTEYMGNKIGRITATGDPQECASTTGSLLEGITVGPDGALWFAESGGKKIGKITTCSASAITEYTVQGNGPWGITPGPDGAVWFTEFGSAKIGRITTAGSISEFPIPFGVGQPEGITPGPDGALWVAPNIGGIVRVVIALPNTTNYIITTVAGNGTSSYSGDGGPATSAGMEANGVSVDSLGNLYVAGTGRIRKVDASPPHNIHTVAGGGNQTIQGSQPATSVVLSNPKRVAAISPDNFFLTETGGHNIDSVSGGIISILTTQPSSPAGVAADGAGDAYIGDSDHCQVLKVTSGSKTPILVAGSTCGHSGDGTAASAQLLYPQGVAVDQSGNNVYVADTGNAQIRKITSGTITRMAGSVDSSGNPLSGYAGDGGPATSALLNGPTDVAVDSAGNLFIADYYNAVIRKVDVKSGNIFTIAGGGANGVPNLGDGGPATKAILSFPYGVAVDAVGEVFVGDALDYRIRKLTPVPVIPNPAITFVAPGSATAGGPSFTLLVHGLNFLQGSTVQWNGAALMTTYIDTGDSQASVPASLIAAPGSASITVQNPDGSASNAITFGISAGPSPSPISITGLSPSSTAAGGPAFTLTVNGTGFVKGAAVLFDSVSTTTIYVSATQLTASIPANLIATAHTATVQVSNSQGGTSNSANFPVNAGNGTSLTIITASPLPGGTAGSQYSQALNATGGATPYKSWTVISGSLPPGISLTTLGGVLTALLTGTPTASGTFTFTVQVTDSAGVTAAKQFNLTIGGSTPTGPAISAKGIVNSASYAGGGVAPGEIVTIYGTGLGPSSLVSFQLDGNGNVPASLAGTQVMFDGVAAPLIYTSATQLSAVVPYEVAGKASTLVQVVYQTQSSNGVTEPVAAVVPGIFTADSSGHGQGAIVNQDGTINSSSNPAPAGSIVFIYGTGEGQTNPAGVDGKPDGSPAPTPSAQPGMTATIGGMNAPVLYAGGVPGLVAGVLQVNVQVPAGSPSGSLPIQLSLGGQNTQSAITIAIK
jgi:uncharacterized protein (TIGR03437 family)